MKNYNKIWDITRWITKNSANYGKIYMKIKFISDNDLSLNKILELCNMIIVVGAVFNKDNKYYPQVVLDERLHK